MREITSKNPQGKYGEMLLWPVLGGLSDEGRHGQKNQKKPFGCFKNFNCKYLGFLAEYKR
jgi:hypothetical protein